MTETKKFGLFCSGTGEVCWESKQFSFVPALAFGLKTGLKTVYDAPISLWAVNGYLRTYSEFHPVIHWKMESPGSIGHHTKDNKRTTIARIPDLAVGSKDYLWPH